MALEINHNLKWNNGLGLLIPVNNIHYNIYNVATKYFTQSQLNSLEVIKSNFFKIYFHIFHPPKSKLPK
jgi:hypothetical protein